MIEYNNLMNYSYLVYLATKTITFFIYKTKGMNIDYDIYRHNDIYTNNVNTPRPHIKPLSTNWML